SMMAADNGGVSRDEKNKSEDLLSRRMRSGSASAAAKQSPTSLGAGSCSPTDTGGSNPITDSPPDPAPKHSATETPSTGPVRVAPAHSTNPHAQPTSATDRTSPTNTGQMSEVPANARTSVMSEADWAAVTKAATSTDAREPEVPEKRR